MPAAAPLALRNDVGRVQNTGSTAKKPKPATHRNSILIVGVGDAAAASSAAAMITSGMIACHLRSLVASEWRLHRIMPIAPTA